MAQKKSNKNKHYPVVRKFEVAAATPVAGTTRLLDSGKVLSQVNRRLYRYGRYYNLKIDLIQNTTQTIEVFALRDDWAVQKAFQMAYQQYLENTSQERSKLSTDQIARWEDFRVSDGVAGAVDDLSAALRDVNMASVRIGGGEFSLSNVVDAGNTKRTFTWNPAAGGSEYSILAEYEKSGRVDLNPATVEPDMAYADIDSMTNDATADDLKTDGNAPPYDANTVNESSPWVRVATLGHTAGSQQLSTGFFTAPCGIVVLKGVANSAADLDMLVCYKPGDYKGVHAPSMLE
jgi:hypothetical protein